MNGTMKPVTGSILAILLTFVAASACVCVDVGFDKTFAAAQAVFLAKVTPSSKTELNIEVQRVWKGEVPKKGKLRDGMVGTDCGGITFNPDIRYIVFASNRPGTDVFYTYACSGTTYIDDKLLGKLG